MQSLTKHHEISTEVSKRELIAEALEQGMINIVVNATLPKVKLPPDLLGSPGILLNLSWGFGLHMELTEEAIEAILTFDGKDYLVSIPYHSIFFLRRKDGTQVIFEQESPIPDVLEELPKRTRHLHLLN